MNVKIYLRKLKDPTLNLKDDDDDMAVNDMGDINCALHKSLAQHAFSSALLFEAHLNSHDPNVALPDNMFQVVERYLLLFFKEITFFWCILRN